MSWIRNIFSRHGANGHEFVDLGLSVCWATMNVGARASYECGKAYTWGDTRQLKDYPRFRYCECCIDKYTKYVTDSLYGDVDYRTTLLPCDDVAHKKMGGDWRMPTRDEIEELIRACKWQAISINHVINCFQVTGKTGNHIILPMDGDSAYLWSASLNQYNCSADALRLEQKDKPKLSTHDRGDKAFVRGVLPLPIY